MQRPALSRVVVAVILACAVVGGWSVVSVTAVQPLAMAQTTSSVSVKAFLATPPPVVLPQATAPLAPVRSAFINPAIGAVLLIAIVVFAAFFVWRRRRTMQA